MKQFILFLLFIGLALPVFAADWVEIAPKIYMDRNIYTSTDYFGNKYPLIWTKNLKNDGDEVVKSMEQIYGKKIGYNLISYMIDCSNRQIKYKSIVTYGLNDAVIDLGSAPSYGGFHDVVPGSTGEILYAYACAGRK